MLRQAGLSATALAVLAAGAPARADLRDVRAGASGSTAEIAIEFDAPPSLSSAAPSPDGLIVFAGGVSARPRLIETASQSLVRMIQVRESEGGVELDLVLAAEASAARARVDGRTLRIEVALTRPWTGPSTGGGTGAGTASGAGERPPVQTALSGAAASATTRSETGSGGAEEPALGSPQAAAMAAVANGWTDPVGGAAVAQTPQAPGPAAATAPAGTPPASGDPAGAALAESTPATPAGAPGSVSGAPGTLAQNTATNGGANGASADGASSQGVADGAGAASGDAQLRTSAEAFAAASTGTRPSSARTDAAFDAAAAAFAAEAAGLRLGGASDPSAAAPLPMNGGGLSVAPTYARAAREAGDDGDDDRAPLDLSRPAAVFAGALSRQDCEAADGAVRADPWDLPSLKRYASCLVLDGDALSAETVFRRLLTFTPDDAEAELGLAVARHERGEAEEAAAVYQRLLEDATADAQAAQLRALLAIAASGG